MPYLESSASEIRSWASRSWLKRLPAVPRFGRSPLLILATCLAAGAAAADSVREVQAPVTRVEPVYETVEVVVPREVCREQEVAVREAPLRRHRQSVTGPILGAVIGGALGNAVGSGKRNKQVGVAVGALLGGSIGADVARQRRDRHDAYPHRGQRVSYHTETVCAVERDYRSERQLTGYRVTYRFAGQSYETFTDYEPGETIPVQVAITPLV